MAVLLQVRNDFRAEKANGSAWTTVVFFVPLVVSNTTVYLNIEFVNQWLWNSPLRGSKEARDRAIHATHSA